MKGKKIWRDPSFWVLLGINVYLVYYYYQQPTIFTTLIWLYWAQSLLMGAFNVLDILTVRKVNTDEQVKQNGKMAPSSFTRRIPSAFFFMLHFGFFHLGYFIFLLGMKKTGPIDWALFRYFLYAFLAGQIIGFIQHKIQQWREETNLGKMFFTPYIRIIPMHLTIIFGSFMGGGMGLFLILKSVADVVMYIVTKPATGNGREAETTMIATQQGMNL